MKIFFLAALVSFTACLAAEVTTTYAPVNSRPLPDELLNTSQEDEVIETNFSLPGRLEGVVNQVLNTSPSDYYPLFSHWVFTIPASYDSVQIEDGSIWQINPKEAEELHQWTINDPVVITQNRNWLSHYNYRIINRKRETSISVSLSQGPLENGAYSRRVSRVDTKNGVLTLSDNTTWDIAARDYSLFSAWAVGDYVIVGANTGWAGDSPYILINVTANHFVRAHQY